MPLKPTSKEEEYFAREDAIKMRKLALKTREQMASDERKKLKDLHYMHCPKCGLSMHSICINQVEIDKCFSCGGLYFDDGEIEKVTGRESTFFKGLKTVFSDD